MSTLWTSRELRAATVGPRVATYEAIPANEDEANFKKLYPDMFRFQAISIGKDNKGTAFLVPLDESSRETADYIIRAIQAYEGE